MEADLASTTAQLPGHRIQKIWPNAANNSTMVRNYLYDGANIVTELNASGAVVASYTQGKGLDEPLAMRRGGYSPTTMPTDLAP